MSWAEIKKSINSNLDIPLNELISREVTYKDKYQLVDIYSIFDNKSNYEAEVLSVTNPKGGYINRIFLKYVLSGNSNNLRTYGGGVYIKLSLDNGDTEILFHVNGPQSGAQAVYMNILSAKSILGGMFISGDGRAFDTSKWGTYDASNPSNTTKQNQAAVESASSHLKLIATDSNHRTFGYREGSTNILVPSYHASALHNHYLLSNPIKFNNNFKIFVKSQIGAMGLSDSVEDNYVKVLYDLY